MGYVIPETTHGDIACSGRKEAYYAYTIIEKLYEAKATNDVHAVYDLFSEKAKENKQLTNAIQELLAVFPENDTYTGATISSEGFERTIHTHSIEVLLTFAQNDKTSFKMQIIYYIENDENPSYEGIHLIELYPYNSIESITKFQMENIRKRYRNIPVSIKYTYYITGDYMQTK